MSVRKPERRRLTPDDWAQAALDTIARGGINAISVETIAGELGATKGSFYWHFANRDALIEAALQRWEERGTDDVIDYLEKEPDPALRLKLLIEKGFQKGPNERAEIALLANPGHPAAVQTVRRVTERRIAYLVDQLEALGWEPQDARDRATLLAYLYVGHIQMSHVAPKVTGASGRRAKVELIFDALIAHEHRPMASTPAKR